MGNNPEVFLDLTDQLEGMGKLEDMCIKKYAVRADKVEGVEGEESSTTGAQTIAILDSGIVYANDVLPEIGILSHRAMTNIFRVSV